MKVLKALLAVFTTLAVALTATLLLNSDPEGTRTLLAALEGAEPEGRS